MTYLYLCTKAPGTRRAEENEKPTQEEKNVRVSQYEEEGVERHRSVLHGVTSTLTSRMQVVEWVLTLGLGRPRESV